MNTSSKYHSLSQIPWKDVEDILQKTDFALQVIGTCEMYGPHMPLGADTMKGEELCHRAAEILREEGIEVLVSEPIPFGISDHHMPFPGTITLNTDTLTKLIIDVCQSLITHGIKKILLVDSHASPEQQACCYNAAYYLQQKYGTTVGVYNGYTSGGKALDTLVHQEGRKDLQEKGHGGVSSTSLLLASKYKNLVKMEKAVKVESKLAESIEKEYYIARKGGITLNPTGLMVPSPGPLEFSPKYGHVGDPTKATEAIGNKLYKILAQELAHLVKRMIKIAEIPTGKRQ
jgi:creatinine amidohydrolase/Fe(II)-dependent formamide hydrolase-like protein